MSRTDVLSLATDFHQTITTLRLTNHIKDRLVESSASIISNANKGYAKRRSAKQKSMLFRVARESLNECQALMLITRVRHPELNRLGRQLDHFLRVLCQTHAPIVPEEVKPS